MEWGVTWCGGSPSFGGPSDHLGSSWAGAPGRLCCLSSFVAGGVVKSTSNLLFTAPPAHGVGLALGFFGGFGVWGFLGGWGFLWIEWWFFDHVGCGVSCRRLVLRHSLSFRISRFFN